MQICKIEQRTEQVKETVVLGVVIDEHSSLETAHFLSS